MGRQSAVRRRLRDGERGAATIAFVSAAALGLAFFVLCAWLVTVQYGLGVVRGALDEGARAGAVFAVGEHVCEQVARDTLSQLLGGRLGDHSVSCRQSGPQMLAEARGSFEAWLPGMPDWGFTLRASSAVEP